MLLPVGGYRKPDIRRLAERLGLRVADVTCGFKAFERDVATGRLTEYERFEDGVYGVFGLVGPSGVAASPDGRHVYATAAIGGTTFIVLEKIWDTRLASIGLLWAREQGRADAYLDAGI